MKFTIFAFSFIICVIMIEITESVVIPVHSDPSQMQRSIAWEIAKLEYYQAKLILKRDLLINAITYITQLEIALLQQIIDALRRLQGMRNSIRENGVLKETDEELTKFFNQCDDLIRKCEEIEQSKQQS